MGPGVAEGLMGYFDKPTLDCQGCGDILRYLTPKEAQMVEHRPYDYVAYCRTCQMFLQEEL